MTDAVQRRINGYWSAQALAYDESQTTRQQQPGAHDVWAQVWMAALPSAPADVLDVCTGSGNVAFLLADLGYRVTAIDLAHGMLREAARKAAEVARAPEFLEADAVAPPFEARSFDAITARYALWTLRDTARALATWRELLRPGGVLVAVDSLWYPDGVRTAHDRVDANDSDREFLTAYDDETLARLALAETTDIRRTAELLTEAGFVDVEITELPEIMDLDSRYGVAPGHRVQMQYRVSSRAPY